MRSYIEEWLQSKMGKLTDEGKQPVGTILVAINERNKNASAS